LLADWGIQPRRQLSFSHIDENEVANLRKTCDEIFGDSNFLFQVTVLCNPKGRSQDKFVANCHEYLIGYSKTPLNKGDLNVFKSDAEIRENYTLKDSRGFYRELELRNTHREFGKHNRKNLYYPFFVKKDGSVSLSEAADAVAVHPIWDDGFEGCWTWGTDKATLQIDEIVAHKVKGSWKIYRKGYALDGDGEATKQVKSIWTEKAFHTEKGQAVLNELFDSKTKVFQAPKSVDTLKQLLLMGGKKDALVLDFFAGSASMAHAVLTQNSEDGGSRKFIMVQIPEECAPNSEAFKAGYKTIAEISKERIRRAGKKIQEENPLFKIDAGFRVLKIDTSNMADIYYVPDAVKQSDLLKSVDNIKPDRINAEDLLFQVLLDWGVDLTLPIVREKIAGKQVYFVDGNALAACFETGVSEDFVKELAARKPLRVVYRCLSLRHCPSRR
jgi:adenine-specific DNA-methyltransferase